MGYKITYWKNGAARFAIDTKKRSNIRSIATICIIIAIIFALLGSTFRQEERELAFSAFDNFAEQIKNGEGFADAITVFCRDILKNANIK